MSTEAKEPKRPVKGKIVPLIRVVDPAPGTPAPQDGEIVGVRQPSGAVIVFDRTRRVPTVTYNPPEE